MVAYPWMHLRDLPTPCLLLDPAPLDRNVAAMRRALSRHGVPLRQHVKTAKSIDVALRVDSARGPITVSTLAEAEAFAAAGFTDILYAVGLVPAKVPRLTAIPANVTGIVDSADVVSAIGDAASVTMPLAIEIDVGQHRGGIAPDHAGLLAIADAIAAHPRLSLAGVIAHAGHAYDAADHRALIRTAEEERAGAVHAAERLHAAGHACAMVSVGSTPTALFADQLDGVTEVRAGVFVLMDRFQAALGCASSDDIAVTVLASVVGVRAEELLLDAGGIALSKDRSMDERGGGYGEIRMLDGGAIEGSPSVHAVNQEHGFVRWPGHRCSVGDRVRILPNHACMTAAQHDGYHVVEGDRAVAWWPRVRGY